MRAAVFLDRDGTINDDEGYFHAADRLRFVPHAVAGISASPVRALLSSSCPIRAASPKGCSPQRRRVR